MMIGYIDKDGFAYDKKLNKYGKRIIDGDNNIILENAEKILAVGWTYCGIGTKWRSFLFEIVFDYEEGMLYRTNKRFLCIREIRPWKKWTGGPGLFTSIPKVQLSEKLKKLGAKEFFEIPLCEVKAYKEPSDLCILHESNKFHMWIPTNKTERFFGDLIDKKIQR